MKYCNYCGCPIDEPANFCPKCGHQLPPEIANAQFQTEKAKRQPQTPPQRFTAYGMPISDPAPAPAAPQIRTDSDKRDGMGSVKALLIVCFLVTAFLFAMVLNTPAGIEDTWKMTLDVDEASELFGSELAPLTAFGIDQVILELELGDKGSMSFDILLDGGSFNEEMRLIGVYSTSDDGIMSLFFVEGTTSTIVNGSTTKDSLELNKEFKVNYEQEKNTLILRDEGIELQFERN